MERYRTISEKMAKTVRNEYKKYQVMTYEIEIAFQKYFQIFQLRELE